MTPWRIFIHVVAALCSLGLLIFGVLLILAGWTSWDAFGRYAYDAPMHTDAQTMLVFDGWLWIGILSCCVGVAVNPLLYRLDLGFARGWRASLVALLVLPILAGITLAIVRHGSGFSDFRRALDSQGVDQTLALKSASKKGHARATHALGLHTVEPADRVHRLVDAYFQGSPAAAKDAGAAYAAGEGIGVDLRLATWLQGRAAAGPNMATSFGWQEEARSSLVARTESLANHRTAAVDYLSMDECSAGFCFGARVTCDGPECVVDPRGFDPGLSDRDLASNDGSILLRMAHRKVSAQTIERAAKDAHPAALYLHGVAMLAEDPALSRRLFAQAVDMGFERALPALAVQHMTGNGGAKDVPEAIRLLDRTTGTGKPTAQLLLADHQRSLGTGESMARAYELFRQSASAGHRGAPAELAWFELIGWEGRPATPQSAIEQLRAQVESDSPYAMFTLGNALRWGIGTTEDKKAALDLFRRAARSGHASANAAAGMMLSAGEGSAAADPVSAVDYLIAAQPHGPAAGELARLLIRGNAPIPEGTSAEDMAMRADALGHPEGIVMLASAWRDGNHGRTRDPVSAVAFARPAYRRVLERGPSEEGGWPVYGLELARTVQAALRDKVVAENPPGELAELDRRWGTGTKRSTVSVTLAFQGKRESVTMTLWDAPEGPIPTDLQLDWLEQARKATPDPEVREAFRKLHALARTNNVSFVDLVDYAMKQQPATEKPAAAPATAAVPIDRVIAAEADAADEAAKRYWDTAARIDDEFHIGTMFNEYHANEHRCHILGRLLGIPERVAHLSLVPTVSLGGTTSDDALDMRMAGRSLENFAYSARSLLAEDDKARRLTWNLDCSGKLGIAAGTFSQDGISTFYVVEHDGRVLRVLGDIEQGFAQKLIAAVDANPGVETVALGSRGGYVYEAMTAGRFIRERRLGTSIWNACSSACPLVFLGGASRDIMSPYPALGFHQVSIGGEAIPAGSQAYVDIERYAVGMGVDGKALIDLMMAAAPAQMNVIAGNEDRLCTARIATWVQRGCSVPE